MKQVAAAQDTLNFMDINHLIIASLAIIGTVIAIVIMRKGGSGSRKSEIEGLMSSALFAKQSGSTDEAQGYLERSKMLLEQPCNRDDSKLASVYIHIAEIYDRTQKYQEARTARENLINLWTKQLESGDQCAIIDIEYALTNNSFGPGTPLVCEFYNKVVAIKERSLGEKHPDVANSYLIKAKLLRVLGEKEQAEFAEQRAAEISG
jgi:tetratricopeptide (TPR) repeat protein